MTTSSYFSPLPALVRFYFYGLHGVFDEVVFTALFDFFMHSSGNPQLRGHSSISSFVTFGTCSFCLEVAHREFAKHRVPLLLRLPGYLCIVYAGELLWGLVLQGVGMCTWDYSHYTYNLWGLVTLEYAPAWLILCLLQDRLSPFLLSLGTHRQEHAVYKSS